MNRLGVFGASALSSAARLGHVDALKALLSKNADANMVDDEGVTALGYAARNGKADCVRALVEGRADVDREDCQGWRRVTIKLHLPEKLHVKCHNAVGDFVLPN